MRLGCSGHSTRRPLYAKWILATGWWNMWPSYGTTKETCWRKSYRFYEFVPVRLVFHMTPTQSTTVWTVTSTMGIGPAGSFVCPVMGMTVLCRSTSRWAGRQLIIVPAICAHTSSGMDPDSPRSRIFATCYRNFRFQCRVFFYYLLLSFKCLLRCCICLMLVNLSPIYYVQYISICDMSYSIDCPV